MKTLVIHPKDSTTDFLSAIYADKGWDVINTNVSKSYLCSQIKDHDRIILMGHGTDQGLIGYNHYVIDSRFVYLLRDPNKTYIFIWCNSDLFVQKYKLKAFHTGMIISEYEEALMFCIPTTSADLDHSNKILATAFRHSIDSKDMLGDMRLFYAGVSPVVQFNQHHFYDNR
jgi:hypothetical protein